MEQHGYINIPNIIRLSSSRSPISLEHHPLVMLLLVQLDVVLRAEEHLAAVRLALVQEPLHVLVVEVTRDILAQHGLSAEHAGHGGVGRHVGEGHVRVHVDYPVELCAAPGAVRSRGRSRCRRRRPGRDGRPGTCGHPPTYKIILVLKVNWKYIFKSNFLPLGNPLLARLLLLLLRQLLLVADDLALVVLGWPCGGLGLLGDLLGLGVALVGGWPCRWAGCRSPSSRP